MDVSLLQKAVKGLDDDAVRIVDGIIRPTERCLYISAHNSFFSCCFICVYLVFVYLLIQMVFS